MCNRPALVGTHGRLSESARIFTVIWSEAPYAITLVLSVLTVGCQSPQHDREVLVYMIIWHLFSSYMSLNVHPVERRWSAEIERRGDRAGFEG